MNEERSGFSPSVSFILLFLGVCGLRYGAGRCANVLTEDSTLAPNIRSRSDLIGFDLHGDEYSSTPYVRTT